MTELHTYQQDYANLYITLTSIIVIASIDKPDQYRMQMEFWTHQREAERWKLKDVKKIYWRNEVVDVRDFLSFSEFLEWVFGVSFWSI